MSLFKKGRARFWVLNSNRKVNQSKGLYANQKAFISICKKHMFIVYDCVISEGDKGAGEGGNNKCNAGSSHLLNEYPKMFAKEIKEKKWVTKRIL